uniref:Histone-lysine N-methyltransferase ASHH2 n=1 Tax=Rhizophora mucronata TaxID=61149 RepID=A0A2P2L0A5_RHIMU
MGSCDNPGEVQERFHQDDVENHSCLLPNQSPDSGKFLRAETRHSFGGSDVDPTIMKDGCPELSCDGNAGCLSSGDVLNDVFVDRKSGLGVGSPKVAGLVGGTMLEDKCRISVNGLGKRQSGMDDCNVQSDGFSAEEVVSKGEGVGLLNLLENHKRSLELMMLSGSTRNSDQQDENKDGNSPNVQGVKEEKRDGLAEVDADRHNKVVPLLGYEIPAEFTWGNFSPRNCLKLDKQKDAATSMERVEVYMEASGVDLAGVVSDSGNDITFSLNRGMLSELTPMTFPVIKCVQQDHQKEGDSAACSSMDVSQAMEEKHDVSADFASSQGLEKPLELMAMTGSLERGVEQGEQRHDKPVSSAFEEKVTEVLAKECDLLVKVATVTESQILTSLDSERCLESVSFSDLQKDCPQQNELDTKTVSSSAKERDADWKSDASIMRSNICTEVSLHCNETPIKSSDPGYLISNLDVHNDLKGSNVADCLLVQKVQEHVEAKCGTDRCTEALPLQACDNALGNLPVIGSQSDCILQNEQRDDSDVMGPLIEGMLETVEEKSDVTSDMKVEISSQAIVIDGNVDAAGLVLAEMAPDFLAEKSVSLQSSQPFGALENETFVRLDVPHLHGNQDYSPINSCAVVRCSGQMDEEGKDQASHSHFSETYCLDIRSSSSRKGSRVRKSSRKTRVKGLSGKSRTTTKVPDMDRNIEIFSISAKGRRSCFSRPARSSAWGLFGNITQIFGLTNAPRPDEFQNCGLPEAKVGGGHKKRNRNQVGGNSRSSGGQNASTNCIRLKIKLGKGICQNSLHTVVPDVNDCLASANTVISDHVTESCKGTSFETPNSVNCFNDKVGEEKIEKQLQCFDKKGENTQSYGSVIDVHLVNEDLDSTLIPEKSAGETAENYLGNPSHIKGGVLGAATEKRYTDPGTSPDSEVINSIPESQIVVDATFSSKDITAPGNVSRGKKGKKKERLSQAGKQLRQDGSKGLASIGQVKGTKKILGRQKEGDGFCSSEILTLSTSPNTSTNSSSSKELLVQQIPLSGEIDLGVSGEALKADTSAEVNVNCSLGDLRLSESPSSKTLLPSTKVPSTKVKGHRLSRKSNGVRKRGSKISDSARSRRANGCKRGGNGQKSVNKKKAKEKGDCNPVHENQDDPEKAAGNNTVAEIGQTDISNNIVSVDVANLDMASSGIMEQYSHMDNAWVRCDDCHKWRRIPFSLVDSIGQTNCKWICMDNMDKAYADCSIPQEKANEEINAELGLSDADEETCDFPLDNVGLEPRHITVPKEHEFTHISSNQFLHRSRKTQTIDEIMVCHCKVPLDGGPGCGDECLNRMLNIECVQGTCPCGDLCSNQQFQKRNYAKMQWDRCGKKGFGLRSEEDISKGQFLIEYVGEVLDMHTYEARQREYASKAHKHFYFMTLNASEVIDACGKGNLGRFINHSCDPNCRTEKWVVNGEICIGLFALQDIKKGEEVTFDYNYVRVFGAAAKECYCGSPQCRGYIGGDPTSFEGIDQVDSDEEFPEPVMLEERGAGNALGNTISRLGSFEAVPKEVAEGVSKVRDGEENSTAAIGSSPEIEDSTNQSAIGNSQLSNSLILDDIGGVFPSSSQQAEHSQKVEDVTSKAKSTVEQEIPMEVITSKTSSSIPRPETSTAALSKSLSEAIVADTKSKSITADYKRVFVKSRFLIKTSHHRSDGVKRGRFTTTPSPNKLQIVSNRSQVPPIKPKKIMEGTSDGHFEAVEEKLNELLDADGGICKRKDAPKGYLKLLLLTAASGASGNGEAIQSNRELSMILDALLKTKSRAVLMDIFNKNGLRMLHNMMKQYRKDFKKIPILRKLLKVLEYMAVREILILEHIIGGPPCPGMESFRESMLSLTEHNDKQVLL